MSNKPKNIATHPNNKISFVEKVYNAFISNMVAFANHHRGFSKHVDSKRPSVLKQRVNH